MPSNFLSQELARNPRLRAALEQLLEARRGAELLKVDVWTFAVELSSLLGGGCTPTQLRLLVAAGYSDHAADVTKPTDMTRAFEPESPLKFGPQTCFVLTEAGIKLLESAPLPSPQEDCGKPTAIPSLNGQSTQRPKPIWDAETRELRAEGQVLKRFRRPAPVLELVLAAFQELDWPPHLDDPLSPEPHIVPEERLRDTVRRLNACQDPHLIVFESDGLGTGIRWGWVTFTLEPPRISHG